MATRDAGDLNAGLAEGTNMQGGREFGDSESRLDGFDKNFGTGQEIIALEGDGFNHAAAIGTIERHLFCRAARRSFNN